MFFFSLSLISPPERFCFVSLEIFSCWSLFFRVSGVKASFGEMLLLIAIHFHSNQNNAIADLVSGTLGMKVRNERLFLCVIYISATMHTIIYNFLDILSYICMSIYVFVTQECSQSHRLE
jgi:hypothetical protein